MFDFDSDLLFDKTPLHTECAKVGEMEKISAHTSKEHFHRDHRDKNESLVLTARWK